MLFSAIHGRLMRSCLLLVLAFYVRLNAHHHGHNRHYAPKEREYSIFLTPETLAHLDISSNINHLAQFALYQALGAPWNHVL